MQKRSMHVFVDLEKAYDRISRDKFWAVLLQYGIADGQLLNAIKSLYMHSEVCVHVNSATMKPFRVSVDYGKAALFHLFCSLFIWME